MTAGRGWRWLGFAVLGFILYLIFLLVFAPAKYLVPAVALLSRNTVVLQEPVGSLWRGSGMLAAPQRRTAPFGQLRWTLRPLQLLMGSVVAELNFSDGDIEARAALDAGWHRYILRDVTATAPVHALTLFYPATEMLGLNGRLQLTVTTLELSKDELRGTAELVWQAASSRLLPITQTGEYRLQMTGQGKRAMLHLRTVEGALQVSAQGEWRIFEDGVIRLQGSVTPTPPQPALDPVLNLIGPLQPGGGRNFNFETRFPPTGTAKLFQ